MNQEEGKRGSVMERILMFLKEVLKLMVMSAATAIVQIGITRAFSESRAA